MIQLNELRLGNAVSRYLLESGTTEIEVITGICKDFVLLSDGTTHHPINNIKPITITREILINTGFTFTGDDWFEYKSTLGKINYNLKHQLCSVSDSDYSNECIISRITPIEFVHQLQNVCYWLAGKELKIIL